MDYQPMYTLLFNAVTDALRELEKQNYGMRTKPPYLFGDTRVCFQLIPTRWFRWPT